MIAQQLILSHCIAAAPPMRLAATHPVMAVVSDPRMCPFLPDVIEPVRDDFEDRGWQMRRWTRGSSGHCPWDLQHMRCEAQEAGVLLA